MPTITKWLEHLAIMRRARKMGTLFPQWQHSTINSAPNGTTEAPTSGFALKRLFKEVGWFRISEHHIQLAKLKSPLRIIQISDVHIRENNEWLEQLNQTFVGLHGDIVALTGDIITRGWTEAALDSFLRSIPRGKLCTVAVMGNWEYWSGETPESWRQKLSRYGIQLLCEEHFQTDSIHVTGTDDHLAGSSHPEQWLADLPDDRPNLILTHSPAHFARLTNPKVQLVLAGHAHGGQIRIPKLGALWTPRGTGRYIAGWYEASHSRLFVSRGLGWSVAPLRFMCPPEVAIIQCTPQV